MKKALLYTFAFIAIQFFVNLAVLVIWLLVAGESIGNILSTLNGGNTQAVSPSLYVLSSAICGITVLSLFVWKRWAVLSPAYLRRRKWGVFFWSATAAAGTLLPSVWLQEQFPALPDTMSKTLADIITNDYGYFVLCILTPFVEETVFRGAILKSLLQGFKCRWTAIIISSVIFAAIHLNLAQMPHALLMGLLFGWLYCRTGSILPGVAVHWVNNTVTFVFCRLFPSMSDATLSEFFNGDTKRIALSVIFSLFILIPSVYQIKIRTSESK